MKWSYFLGFFILMMGCTHTADVFQQYATTVKPVKLGEGSLSLDSIQWNNVFVPKTNELYLTKMGESVSAIYKMNYANGIFDQLQAIKFPVDEPHSDIYISPEADFMLFSSLMPESPKDTIVDWNIWKSVRKNGQWQQPEPFFENSLEANQFYPWMTNSKNVYFSITPHGSRNSDLYVSEYVHGTYQSPKALPHYINSQNLEGDAYVSPDESYLVFAGFERGQNSGKSDLYISFNHDGVWSPPVWLGKDVNSDGYDGSPFVTQDGKYLIFTSSRGSTDENTFFNHYIMAFQPEKYEAVSLELNNYLSNVGKTPTRFELENITTNEVEYGGSFSLENEAFYYTTATPDFSARQIMVSQFKEGVFQAPVKVSFGGTNFTDASDVQIAPNSDYLYFKMRGNVAEDSLRGDDNIWRSKYVNGTWTQAEMLPNTVNSSLSEYYPVPTQSGNLYFSREHEDTSYDLYVSRFVDGKYSQAERLPDHINTNLLESDAYVSPDESYMIFVRMYAEGDLGVSDLYISFNDNGRWSIPKNMRSLNSSGVDGSPFVTSDGKYLFFTSTRGSENPENFDGHLDIYITQFDLEEWK